MYWYTYPILRCNKLTTTILSHNELLSPESIISFYDQPIIPIDRDRIIDSYNLYKFYDYRNIVYNNLINRDPNLPPCTYRELISDNINILLKIIDFNHYYVELQYD